MLRECVIPSNSGWSIATVPRGLPSSITQLCIRAVCRRLFCSWHNLKHQLQCELKLASRCGAVRLTECIESLAEGPARRQRIAGCSGIIKLNPVEDIIGFGAEL